MLAGARPRNECVSGMIGHTSMHPGRAGGILAETKELIAGFWMVQVKAKAEAIEWASRVPFAEEIEIGRCSRPQTFLPRSFLPKTLRASKRCARSSRERQRSRRG
jgi:hypothetical protein